MNEEILEEFILYIRLSLLVVALLTECVVERDKWIGATTNSFGGLVGFGLRAFVVSPSALSDLDSVEIVYLLNLSKTRTITIGIFTMWSSLVQDNEKQRAVAHDSDRPVWNDAKSRPRIVESDVVADDGNCRRGVGPDP